MNGINSNNSNADRQAVFQSTLVECVQTLYMNSGIDGAINQLLEIIAHYYCADRSYIFEFDEDMKFIHNTYEWCADGIEPEIDFLSTVEMSVIDRWLHFFETKGEFYINSLSKEVSEDSDEYKVLEQQGIKSLMAAPLRSGDRLVGFMGVDNPGDNTDMLLLMRLVSAFVVNDIQKRETLEQRILRAIGNTFVSINAIDLAADTQREIKRDDDVSKYVNHKENAAQQMKNVMNALADPKYVQEVLNFSDLGTIADRMTDIDVLSLDFLAADGHWCRGSFYAMNRDKKGRLAETVFAVQHVDAEKKREMEFQRALKAALENQNEIYAEMLHMQGCGVIACQTDTREIIMLNDAAQQLFGNPRRGALLKDVVSPILVNDMGKITAQLDEIALTPGSCNFEFAIRGKEDLVYLKTTARTVVLAGGDHIMILTLMDITDKKRLENRLLVLSETDPLTKICNRGSGERRTERLIADGTPGMFCLLDVNKFKTINDTFGHTVGDKALITVAECLKKSFQGCVVMRLGGDEFSVFAPEVTTEKHGIEMINQFFKAIEASDIPELFGRKITVSMGAVLCVEKDIKFDRMYAMADNAMYLCKGMPGNNYQFYNE